MFVEIKPDRVLVFKFDLSDPAEHLNQKGGLHDNSNHPYTVSKTFPIDNESFGDLIDFVNDCDPIYNLYDNNCSNFAYDAFESAGITLPSSNGTVAERDPGQMGLDLRNGGQANTNPGTAPSGNGECN